MRREFQLRNGEVVFPPSMTKTSSSFGYGETMKLRVVRIPYKENGFYMLLAIPKTRDENIGEPLLLLI